MITLIGTSTTVIGFGLCGVERIIEITRDATIDEVEQHVAHATTPIVVVEERYVDDLATDKLLIPIPDRYANAPHDRMADLVRDVIGSKGDTSWE